MNVVMDHFLCALLWFGNRPCNCWIETLCTPWADRHLACITGMTGPVVIDYKGDRIMDYQVWYLASGSDKFNGYMKIPLTLAGRSATVCAEWLVKRYYAMHRLGQKNEPFLKVCNSCIRWQRKAFHISKCSVLYLDWCFQCRQTWICLHKFRETIPRQK